MTIVVEEEQNIAPPTVEKQKNATRMIQQTLKPPQSLYIDEVSVVSLIAYVTQHVANSLVLNWKALPEDLIYHLDWLWQSRNETYEKAFPKYQYISVQNIPLSSCLEWLKSLFTETKHLDALSLLQAHAYTKGFEFDYLLDTNIINGPLMIWLAKYMNLLHKVADSRGRTLSEAEKYKLLRHMKRNFNVHRAKARCPRNNARAV